MHRGSIASLALMHFKDSLNAHREAITKELCYMYRSGELDFPIICGKLGALTLIEDTLAKFEREIKQAQSTEEKLNVRNPGPN